MLKNKRDVVDNPAEYNHPGNIFVKIGNTDRYGKEFYRIADRLHPYDEAFQHGYNYNIGRDKYINYVYNLTTHFLCLQL